MTGTLTMNQKERDRLKVLTQIQQNELTVALAAENLQLSPRQLYRLLSRYHQQGDAGLVHRLRGRPSNRAYDETDKIKAVRLYRERYHDYGPTLFSEVLVNEHALTVAPETLRRWLIAASLWAGSRRKRPHRRQRERRTAIGSLVQFDGSPHDWVEGRGPDCTLLVAIDDASNRVFLRFAESENTREVFFALRAYFERFGLPRAFYTDRGGVFYGEDQPTAYQRAMKALGVNTIFAHSPQAKGRVERSNRTHQDRLIKALRRHNISHIAAANRFLEQTYHAEHNRDFAQLDGLPDLHRSIDGIDLTNILCFETRRQVRNDYTITLDAQYLQLERGDAPLPPPKHEVTVRRWLDDSLHLFWNEHELKYKILSSKPIPQTATTPRRPAADHPWRRRPVGKGFKNAVRNGAAVTAAQQPLPKR